MSDLEKYPRVLFVTSHAFNHSTGGGVTFSNLFSGWPKDRLGTVHNDPLSPETDVCELYFRLGAKELSKWGPLRLLQRSPRETEATTQADASVKPLTNRSSFVAGRSFLFGSNEFPETAYLSPELETWIEKFSPQILYTILGSNGFMDLIELIRVRFNLPLVVHIMDDWRAISHTKGLLAPLRKKKMERLFSHFMTVSSRRMGISDSMCRAYEAEYGYSFETFHNGIETGSASPRSARKKTPNDSFSIFYGGAVLPFAQLQSLTETCEAIARLNEQGLHVRFDIFCPPAMTDPYRDKLLTCDTVHLHPPLPRHEDYLSAMQNADLLLLPVNFNNESIKFIRYSMPTKVPEMMRSGVPVMVYGPAGVAQIDYACKQGWAYPVTIQGVENVVTAIKVLAADDALRHELADTAYRISCERHDIASVRSQFRTILADAAT